MKHRNIASSRSAEMFSARRRSQRPTVIAWDHKSGFFAGSGACTWLMPLLDRVDLLECALGPITAVFIDVPLLGKGAERILVGLVDRLAFLLEELDRFLLLRVVLGGTRVENLARFD